MGTHATPAPNRAHSGLHGETRGVLEGTLPLPSERFARSGNPAWPGVRTANFAAFGSWSGVLPKSAESLRNSNALMRVAVPRRRGHAGSRYSAAVSCAAPVSFAVRYHCDEGQKRKICCWVCCAFACGVSCILGVRDSSLVTAVRFWNRCLRRSMRGTCLSEQRSGCRF